MKNLTKVIIWGHKLHDHTHSYIHNAFYRTFKYLGYDVYWFDNEYSETFNFDNCLFITHGMECSRIPINNTSYYLFHNCHLVGDKYKIPHNHIQFDPEKEIGIDINNILVFQVLTKDCYYRDKKYLCTHIYRYNQGIIYFPWGTDLTPQEIDNNIENYDLIYKKCLKENKEVNFVGMPLEQWDKLKNEVNKRGINYNNYGGTFDCKSERNKDVFENMELIQQSILAPALQTKWQVDNHYIPCRIFKNISYGKMGITNNQAVNKLFDNKLIYSEDIEELVIKGLEFEESSSKKEKVIELMKEVRDKHTYVNRIQFILDFIKDYSNISVTKPNKSL
tara:strand:+ start:146 stop:1147 length:1002 start_codon:yes stop_codon:yes gene_type:complete